MKTRIMRGVLALARVIPVRAISLRVQIVQAHIVSKETHMLSREEG